MQRRLSIAVFGAAWLIAGGVAAAPAAKPGPAASAPYRAPGAAAHGYLTAARLPDAGRAIGPPPSDESGAKAGDVATYKATRALQGTPRWDLAARDADFGPYAMLKAFSCAVGVTLDRKTAPALFRLFSRMVVDSDAVSGSIKADSKRRRPFQENPGQICIPEEAWLKTSYSYPSGHTTYSWSTALALAEIAPERAIAVLARARSYGESRVVCGVHYTSDVTAGRAGASILFSTLQANAQFRADLARARLELIRLRAHPRGRPGPAECASEAEAAATPIW